MALDEAARNMLKQAIGITDADLEKLGSNIEKVLASYPNMAQYRIVAEVVSSRYCFAGIQPGQKIVFNAVPPILNPQESNCPLCMRALGPLTNIINVLMDRLAQGVDPNDSIWRNAECLDPGVENGGLGKVVFRVYAEKAG